MRKQFLNPARSFIGLIRGDVDPLKEVPPEYLV
jgi:hypothetical protein